MKTILIQNADRAVSARDYTSLGTDLLVASTFATIQGEGPYAGYPSMFLRLSGCNYGDKGDHCQFCDTTFNFDKGTRYSVEALLAHLLADPAYHRDQILVITGGEPTLQQNLLAFMVKAKFYFKDIQLETNGTQPKFYRAATERNMASSFMSVVSPKANMRLGKYPPVHPEVLWWAKCLKFVVSADPLNAHHEVPEWALESNKIVYVSPMVVYKEAYEGEVSSVWQEGLIDREATAANFAYAAAYAMKHNLVVSVQMHIFLGIA